MDFWTSVSGSLITNEWHFTSAQTNAILVASAAGSAIGVSRASVAVDGDCTVNVHARLGFGATALPALSANDPAGVPGILLSHPDIPPGSGDLEAAGGLLGLSGDSESLVFTCDNPAGGSVRLVASYFVTAS
jgi:hypothetical protein